MRVKTIIGLLLTFFFFLIGCTSSYEKLREEPKIDKDDKYFHYKGFSLVYDIEYKIPRWVSYELNINELGGGFPRQNYFTFDPLLDSLSACKEDFVNSGFDRGHLAPAADMSWDRQVMKECFYYTNVAPQSPSFNRGIWKSLEEQIREWAKQYKQVYITTGPICSKTNFIGPGKVNVPQFFFKTVLVYSRSYKSAVGFIIPNQKCNNDISTYTVTVDSIEEITGLDLYHSLPDGIERKIEKNDDFKIWFNKAGN